MHPDRDSAAVLIVEDDQSVRDILIELFAVDGTDVTAVATLDEAKRALGRQTYELIVTDLNLAGKRDGGLQVMAAAGLLSTDAPIIVLTAFPDVKFMLTDIVIGPQGVVEQADVEGTFASEWLGQAPTGERVEWKVVIFFPFKGGELMGQSH